jgi:uncharacterized protein (DUF885 family)
MTDPIRTLSALSEEFVEVVCRLDPVAATLMGIHDYDDKFPDDSPAGFDERVVWLRDLGARLESGISAGDLSHAQRVDFTLLRSRVESMRFQLEELRTLARNPVRFTETAMQGVFLLMERPFAPLDERKEALLARLIAIPDYLERARTSIEQVPPVFADLARELNLTGPSYVDDVARALMRHFPHEAERIEHAAGRARVGFSRYQEFLERELTRHIGGSHAIGEGAMNALLQKEHLIARDSAEIEALGVEHVAKAQSLLEDEARRLDPQRDWHRQVEDALQRHPDPARLRETYMREVERVRRFVADRKIAPIPEGPLQVIDTPVFERMFVPYASYLPPGPFDADQTGVFYVTPVDGSHGRAEQLEQLAGHCLAKIPLVVLHETYPGHHLQRLHANHASSRLRQLSANSCFVEGWALYCEEMMWDQAYFLDPATRLIQLRDLLFRACRAVIDVRLQCGRMSFGEAVEYLVTEAMIEPVNARREVRRYVLAPAQPLSFLVGKLDLLALREEARSRLGERFNLYEFHAGILSGGALPLALARDEVWERAKAG